MQNTDSWPKALAGFASDIDNHYPTNSLLGFAYCQEFIFSKVTLFTPIPHALTVFTDGSFNGRDAYVWNGLAVSFQTIATLLPHYIGTSY